MKQKTYSSEMQMLIAATQAGQRKAGVAVQSAAEIAGGQPIRRVVNRPANHLFKDPSAIAAVLQRFIVVSDDATRLLVEAARAHGIPDAGRASVVWAELLNRSTLGSCRSPLFSQDLVEALGLSKASISRSLGLLGELDLVRLDTRRRPAVIYINPAMAFRGAAKLVEAENKIFQSIPASAKRT